MKLLYVGILKTNVEPTVELCSEKDLSSWSRFTRGSVEEFMTFTAKTIAERTRAGQRQDVEEREYTFHVYTRSEGITGIIISDHEYPSLVAHQVLSKMCDEFLMDNSRASWESQKTNASVTWPKLKEYLTKYQDPQAADSIMRIQNELDETKILMKKTIESVLERGEKIDSLVSKSEDLNSRSKMFYTQAKKQNSCCVVM
ncbi:snare-like protein [Microthyrium microscopicum]|uniref:Synaptobrevin homolog YKT6 n=1 Tax=Microthyrium microscopicum TaxID=703497 RepID=A0A6A6U324_9PEZI|nr:snare-like protein [Microthyrium microscopicum]